MSYEEQIMSKDKYPSIFSPQMEAIVFIILQIFFATHEVLKIGEYSRIFPGAIIGDGDRKSWDARGPMILDFWRSGAVQTTY